MRRTIGRASTLTWGEFFSKLRTDRGYSLRDLHRKYGVDPSIVWRHERGIKKPEAKRLHEYAQMLGLKPGSEEWNKYFALAVEETGRFNLPFWPLKKRSKKRLLGLLEGAILLSKENGITDKEILDLADSIQAMSIPERDHLGEELSEPTPAPVEPDLVSVDDGDADTLIAR